MVSVAAIVWLALSILLYRPFYKRFYDILLSAVAIVVLSPLLLVLTVLGAIKMGGNPIFAQERPGKKEKIFRLIKFRTMTNKRGPDGELLPDSERLTGYGRFLRATSLDELPELFNIFVGQMSIVGPRPLLAQYLPLYNEEQKKRHSVRPGLTGLAQVSGRNAITWEQKFEKDLDYVCRRSLWLDIKILWMTVVKVFRRDGISHAENVTMTPFAGNIEEDEREDVP